MSPRTNSSHNSSPSNQSLTMSSSITNSPAGLTNNILNSSPHSNNSPHNVQNSSPLQGDELLNNNQLNDNNLINNLNNSLSAQPNDNGLNQLVLNNQSPLNSTSSPLSNVLNNSNNLLKQDQELKTEMYNQTNLNGLLSSNNQNLSPPLNKINRKLDTNETSLNTSINSTNISSNLNQQQQLATSTVQWTGTQTNAPATNYSASRYQPVVNNSSTYQTTPTNQFGPNNSNNNNLNNINNSNNNQSISLNSSNQQSNLNTASTNSPYLDFNLNNNYTGSMLNHAPSTPNMFTAAAVAAANSGALCNQTNNNTSKTQSSNLNNQNSDFPFNNNNNLTKKYLESSTNLPTSGLDQQLFYGNSTTNGITPLNKTTTALQSNSTSSTHKPEFISTSLANNYANFAPNSNASYWQTPGTTSQQCMNNTSNMYQTKQIQSNNLNHTPPSGQQIDEASQASTPNSQLDELRSDTPNTKLSNNQINGSTYLTSTINGVSNNSSSNSSTGSMASSANSISLNNGKNGMPVYSFPPTPNTIGSPGTSASVMSGFYDEYEPVQNTTWSKNHRLDGLMKLYEISNEPGRKIFLDKLVLFNEECGNTVSSCPTISKNLIDLYSLYCLVKERGGFIQTTKSKQWKEVANLILNNTKLQPTSSYILRKQYVRHLLPFECKFDLGGADPKLVQQQIENANRKKRKNKTGNEPPIPGMQTPPNTIDNQLNNNLVINKNNLNQMQLNQQPPPPSTNSNHPNMNSSIGVSPINQNIQLNRHLTMQQQTNFQQTNNPNNLPPNSIMPNGPNQFHTTPGQITLNSYTNYSNYNSNLPGANYMQNVANGPQYTNAPNNGYNQTTIDYQNKLNHQLNQQNQQFFTNSSQINQTPNSASQLVNPSEQLHSSIPSNNQQSSSLNNSTSLPPQQYYQQQNNTMFNLNINGQQTNDNFFYSNQLNSVHNSSTTSNQQLNNMQFNDEMINKYNTSLKQELNSSQSSLPTNQQLNNSNNTQYYSGVYQDNTTINPNYSTSVYSRSQPPQPQSNNYQLNGYSNGILDNNSFDKTNPNLLDFQSTIKTESNNLDYLSDPYSYEPDNKRVCF